MIDRKEKEGFTLVEIALALLVVAIGVVSIMALFPAGLQANQQGGDETRVALFAADVLNGVRALIEETPRIDVEDALDSGIPSVGSGILSSLSTIRPSSNSDPEPIIFKSSNLSISLEEFALRYNLQVFEDGDDRFGVLLQVWPNEYGPKDFATLKEMGEAYVFYTEVYHNYRF
jgi:competence protein ComGF